MAETSDQTTRLADIQVGARVRCTHGFGPEAGLCLCDGDERVVMENGEGLYVECAEGAHQLDGSLDDDGEALIDFVLVEAEDDRR